MYRFITVRALFSQLQRQANGVNKRYYQCNGIGVYGYRQKKVEPFKRKLPLKIDTNDVASHEQSYWVKSMFSVCLVIVLSFLIKKMERSLLFGSYKRQHIKDTKILLITSSADKQRGSYSVEFISILAEYGMCVRYIILSHGLRCAALSRDIWAQLSRLVMLSQSFDKLAKCYACHVNSVCKNGNKNGNKMAEHGHVRKHFHYK